MTVYYPDYLLFYNVKKEETAHVQEHFISSESAMFIVL